MGTATPVGIPVCDGGTRRLLIQEMVCVRRPLQLSLVLVVITSPSPKARAWSQWTQIWEPP